MLSGAKRIPGRDPKGDIETSARATGNIRRPQAFAGQFLFICQGVEMHRRGQKPGAAANAVLRQWPGHKCRLFVAGQVPGESCGKRGTCQDKQPTNLVYFVHF